MLGGGGRGEQAPRRVRDEATIHLACQRKPPGA
jgi:hypothetical protein